MIGNLVVLIICLFHGMLMYNPFAFLTWVEVVSVMDDPRRLFSEKAPNGNRRKQNPRAALVSQVQQHYVRGVQELPPTLPSKPGQKASKNCSKTDVLPFFQQQQRKITPEMPESTYASEYRGLTRRYLLLEEEKFVLQDELRNIEDENKTLEDEKLILLDQLLVLEGLVDSSESLHHH